MNLIKGFRLLRFLLLAAILLFPLSSCTTLPDRGVKPNYTVAVLPINNAITPAIKYLNLKQHMPPLDV